MSQGMSPSPSMLRARRRDVCVKPNRVLDKSSSRGMIYENEELRLRTININAEIERGQSEVKKLRRENEHLKREIWSLREELERLEVLLRQKEQEEEEDAETDDEEDEEGEDDGGDEKKSVRMRIPRVTIEPDGLSIVPEESEEGGSTPEPQPANTCMNPERGVEEYNGTLPPCIRLNCLHPFTVAATLPPTLSNITVMEVIESSEKATSGVVGIRLLEGSVYISTKGKQDLEALLAQGVVLRGERLSLQDVSQGTVVLALSAIPHDAKDQDILRLLSQFGPLIGGVERRVYRGADTGEGLARIRPLASLPKRLFLDGAEISVRPLSHEELSKLSMQQHFAPKQPTNLFVKVEREEAEVKFSDNVKTGSNSIKNEPFSFPVPSTSTSTPSTPKQEERSQSVPVGTPVSHGSAQSLRPHSDTEVKRPRRLNSRRAKSPSSSSEQDSPTKPQRRRPSAAIADRERSISISSRASYRRKLSMTGRETGKLPWCACWGNGCI